MKRAMSLMLVLLLCFAMAIPASAATPVLSPEGKIEHLIDCGLPADVLNELDESVIDAMYQESLGNYIELVSYDKTNEVSMVNGNARRAITDGDFEMDTSVLAVYESDRVTFRYYAVYTRYEWLELPAYRMRDGITVNWDADLLTFMSGTFYYDPSYKATANSSWTDDTANYTDVPDNLSQGGVGVTFDLRNYASALKGTAFIRLAKKNAASSGNYTAVNSNYAHTTEELAADSLTIGLTDVNTTFVCRDVYQNSASSESFTIP